jgi:tRNA(adenine34) deaminase
MDHEPFMRLALAEAEASLAAGEFPVGAVLVADGAVLARGRRSHSKNSTANELDHAEVTALRELLARQPAVARGRLVLYATMEPCLMCYSTLLLNGIRTFVYAYEDAMGGGTSAPLAELAPLYREMAGEVRIIPHVLRRESLALFQRFFLDPKNGYWQDSLLSRYTLSQP